MARVHAIISVEELEVLLRKFVLDEGLLLVFRQRMDSNILHDLVNRTEVKEMLINRNYETGTLCMITVPEFKDLVMEQHFRRDEFAQFLPITARPDLLLETQIPYSMKDRKAFGKSADACRSILRCVERMYRQVRKMATHTAYTHPENPLFRNNKGRVGQIERFVTDGAKEWELAGNRLATGISIRGIFRYTTIDPQHWPKEWTAWANSPCPSDSNNNS